MAEGLSSTNKSLSLELDPAWLEVIIKGIANRRRIQMLQLIKAEPDISLSDICQKLNIEYKSGSEHTRKLEWAGLIFKRKDFSCVHHQISDRGNHFLSFLSTIR